LSVEFYQGKEMEPLETADLMRNADHVHLVGKESVKLAKEEGLVDEEQVLYVEGVPHAEMTRL